MDMAQARLAVENPTPGERRTQGGEATTDVVVSATVGRNADVFPDILRIHVPVGAIVADVTYGKGPFWRDVPAEDYVLMPSDLQTGTDATNLPYEDESL